MQSNNNSTEETQKTSPDYNSLRWNFKDSPDYTPSDIVITTDGSGYLDKIGGFGALILSSKYLELNGTTAYGCSNHTETGRAELYAIVHALHATLEKLRGNSAWELENLRETHPTILVLSDRQDVVGKANKLFKRNVDLDLWQAYDYYETYFDIIVRHIPRDTLPIHKSVDALASELRLVLLDFTETQKDAKHI
jgi:ribonuclease HI